MPKTDGPKDLTPNEKRTLYRMGLYRMPVPMTVSPLETARWDEDVWIHWIDDNGQWLGLDGG